MNKKLPMEEILFKESNIFEKFDVGNNSKKPKIIKKIIKSLSWYKELKYVYGEERLDFYQKAPFSDPVNKPISFSSIGDLIVQYWPFQKMRDKAMVMVPYHDSDGVKHNLLFEGTKKISKSLQRYNKIIQNYRKN